MSLSRNSDPIQVIQQIGRDQLAHASRRRRCPVCHGKPAIRVWRPGDCWYDPAYDVECPRCEGSGLAEDRP